MRFPLLLKPDVPWIEYTNISSALAQSLIENGIIDPRDGKSQQGYFELDIAPTSLSEQMQSYELSARLHVGCSIDERPPSLDLEAGARFYHREIYLEVAQRAHWFRTVNGNRDLFLVARALSDPSCFREEIISLLHRS